MSAVCVFFFKRNLRPQVSKIARNERSLRFFFTRNLRPQYTGEPPYLLSEGARGAEMAKMGYIVLGSHLQNQSTYIGVMYKEFIKKGAILAIFGLEIFQNRPFSPLSGSANFKFEFKIQFEIQIPARKGAILPNSNSNFKFKFKFQTPQKPPK